MSRPNDDFYDIMYCNLLNNKDWHKWLHFNDNEVLNEVVNNYKKLNCSSGKAFMNRMLNKLYNGGLKDNLLAFIIRSMPMMIRNKTKQIDNPVFKFYNPNILTFPRKLIIKGIDVERKTKEFVRNKCGVDYLIIGDTSYVEYFDYEHRNIMKTVKQEDRELYKFKKEHSL